MWGGWSTAGYSTHLPRIETFRVNRVKVDLLTYSFPLAMPLPGSMILSLRLFKPWRTDSRPVLGEPPRPVAFVDGER